MAVERASCVVAGALVLLAGLLAQAARAGESPAPRRTARLCVSGIYPHLAAFSPNGECGIGAVVDWAGKLYFLTYPPHHTTGGPDKLYEVAADLTMRIRPESVGGTHAGRMIHRESNQLVLGPYFIDAKGRVRSADVKTKLVGRMTAVMRHLKDPANKVYLYDMEGKVYEVDVHTLAVTKLFDRPVPGDHGKGGYTAQGRVVISNNGERGAAAGADEAGALAEWDGTTWRVVERKQFCEVTGPGGIHGSPDANSPLWATGWDRRSVILKLLDQGVWHTFRLPKASRCYDGTHGWYTEWPRIREIAPGRLMMDMHGMFYDFPRDFAAGRTGALAPMASHLRMIVDYCPWQGRVVLASDDTSVMANRPAGQSQSNLWFVEAGDLGRLGAPAGVGGPWLHDEVRPAVPSDPFLIKGFTRRCLHLATETSRPGRGAMRCTGRFELGRLEPPLAALLRVTIARGDYHQPAPAYGFTVNRDVVVYLGVDARGGAVPAGWEKTPLRLSWGPYTDTVYRRAFKKGRVDVPGQKTAHTPGAYPLPNICFVGDASGSIEGIEIGEMPKTLGARVARPTPVATPATGPVTFTVQIDRRGDGTWADYRTIRLPPAGYAWHVLPEDLDACWVRLTADGACIATAQFHVASPARRAKARPRRFASLPAAGQAAGSVEGIVRPAGGDNRNLQFLARPVGADGRPGEPVLYEVDETLAFRRVADAGAAAEVTRRAAIARDVTVDDASVVYERGGKRYRLPKGPAGCDKPLAFGWARGRREVVTERDLLNAHGTFYEVPRDNSAGVRGMRPIASHGKHVADFCTWRGLFVMSGARAGAEADGHFFGGSDGVGLWFGAVDDLWSLPKPTGTGGPWRRTRVRPGEWSDPYLMTGYDRKRVELSHDAAVAVTFSLEIDAVADGTWWPLERIEVPSGKTVTHRFADGFSARWVRVSADRPCKATAWFVYE